jgi:hypothetical protein
MHHLQDLLDEAKGPAHTAATAAIESTMCFLEVITSLREERAELLEAARFLVRCTDLRGVPEDVAYAVEMARAAIAKAEGK